MDIPAAVRQNVIDQSILLLQRNVPALDNFNLVQGILCAPGSGHFLSGKPVVSPPPLKKDNLRLELCCLSVDRQLSCCDWLEVSMF